MGVRVGIESGTSPVMGMIKDFPTTRKFGSTPGFAFFKSSRLTPYFRAIPDIVSPLAITWVKGVAVDCGGGVTVYLAGTVGGFWVGVEG